MIFSNLIKSDDEIGNLIFLERRLKDESTKSNITKFGSIFVETSSNEQERNSKIKIHEKLKLQLKLSQITIRK